MTHTLQGKKIIGQFSEQFNRACFCVSLDSGALKHALRIELDSPELMTLVEERCPYLFSARPVLTLTHGGHAHDYELTYTEHSHGHAHAAANVDMEKSDYQDAHELAHANDIKRQFANRNVTNGQIVMFGITGGLIPCRGSAGIRVKIVENRCNRLN